MKFDNLVTALRAEHRHFANMARTSTRKHEREAWERAARNIRFLIHMDEAHPDQLYSAASPEQIERAQKAERFINCPHCIVVDDA